MVCIYSTHKLHESTQLLSCKRLLRAGWQGALLLLLTTKQKQNAVKAYAASCESV